MKRLAGCLLMVAALGLGACGEEEKEESIQIGVLLSQTGDLANIGVAQAEAAALAVEEINAAGGVLGKQLKIVKADDGSDPEKAKTAAQSLIDQKVPAVVGAVGSGLTLAAAEKLSVAGIVQVSPSSTSPAITTLADDGYLFRTCPSDAFQGKLLAQRAKAKGLTKAAVTYVSGAYGEGLAKAFAETFVAQGGEVSFSEAYEAGATSYAELLGRIFATSPDTVVLPGYVVDSAQMIKDYNLGFTDRGAFWFFSDALASNEFVSAVGANGFSFQHEGSVPSAPSGPRWEEFAAAYKARFGKDATAGYYVAQAYDAVYVIALAMAKAGKAEGAAIRDAMAGISAGGEAYGAKQFKDAIAAIDAGGDVNFEGASGTVDFDAAGDTVAPYDVWQVKDGAISTVESGLEP